MIINFSSSFFLSMGESQKELLLIDIRVLHLIKMQKQTCTHAHIPKIE